MSKLLKIHILLCLILVNQISLAQTFRGFIFQVYYLKNDSVVVSSETEPDNRFYLDSGYFTISNFKTFQMPVMAKHFTIGFDNELNKSLNGKLHTIPFNAKRFLFVDDGCYAKYASYLHAKVNTGKIVHILFSPTLSIRVCINKVEFEGCNLKKSIYDGEDFLNMIAIGSYVKDLEFTESELLAFKTFANNLQSSLFSK